MDEYISKQDILDYLNGYLHSLGYGNTDLLVNGQRGALINAIQDISAIKSADVQSVDRWISVKDRMPETNAIGIAHILAYDRYEGVVKADFFDESANYAEGSNIFEISNTSTQLYKVTHWQPLPEPPKDGDTNG